MAVHAPTVPSVPVRRYPRGLLFVGIGLIVVGALIVGVSVLSRPGVNTTEASVSSGLFETAAIIETHGAAMMDHGRRLAAAARLSTDPNRDHWIADGEHMVADGAGLIALAERLRSAARLLGGHPTSRAEVDLSMIFGEAAALIAEGRGAIDHGRAMVDHANVMVALARQPMSGITEADAALMAEDAPKIIDAGERVMRIGMTLRAFADQMRRSLGR